MKPEWIRELDNISTNIIEKLADMNVHRLDEFMYKFGDDAEACHELLESNLTDSEIIELVEAIWSQYLGIGL